MPRAFVLAVLYDIHGNLPALEAVLADARAAGARAALLGGDYALFGGWPAETVQRLRHVEATWIQGNGERWTARPEEAPGDEVVQGGIAACRQRLHPDEVNELAALPAQAVLNGTLYCHASPISDVRSFLREPGDDEEELLGGVDARRVIFGHTHVPFARTSPVRGIELLNPGSVGMPFDGDPRAAYALVHPGDDAGLRRVEHRRVAYDHHAAAERLRAEHGGAPWAQVVARRIEEARFVGAQ